MGRTELRAYACGVKGAEWSRVIHATTPGRAKSEFWSDIKEPWPGIPYTAITCQVLGKPQTSPDFKRTAKNRGVPFADIGMRVQVGEWNGVLVGNNSSANFDVLFSDGPYAGKRLNCHPNHMMRYFGEDGTVLADFNRTEAA